MTTVYIVNNTVVPRHLGFINSVNIRVPAAVTNNDTSVFQPGYIAVDDSLVTTINALPAVVSAPREVATSKRGRSGATVNSSNQVVINLPPGSDREQVERICKVVRDEQDKQSRRLMAGFAREGG